MNRIEAAGRTGHDEDFALWCDEQATALRSGRLATLDRGRLAEEIESLGRSEKYEIESRLLVLLVHLLKWRAQPSGRSSGWRGTIVEQRSRIARRLADSPSLAAYPASIMAEEYAIARLKAADEAGLPLDRFPETAPFDVAQVLDPDFWPDAA